MYKFNLLFSVRTYKALLQKGQSIIVFYNEKSGPISLCPNVFYKVEKRFNVYGSYIKLSELRKVFVYNFTSEMRHCGCFIMASLVLVNMDVLIFE